jgi:hypothetical protein
VSQHVYFAPCLQAIASHIKRMILPMAEPPRTQTSQGSIVDFNAHDVDHRYGGSPFCV